MKTLIAILFCPIFSLIVLADKPNPISGYKDVKWGTSIKEATRKLNMSAGSCHLKLMLGEPEIASMLAEESGINYQMLMRIASENSRNESSEIQMRSFDGGCGIFVKNALRIILVNLYDSFDEVKGALEKKYGIAKMRTISPMPTDKKMFSFEGDSGKICLFVDKGRRSKTTVVLYASKELSSIAEVQHKEFMKNKKQNGNNSKKKRLDSL